MPLGNVLEMERQQSHGVFVDDTVTQQAGGSHGSGHPHEVEGRGVK